MAGQRRLATAIAAIALLLFTGSVTLAQVGGANAAVTAWKLFPPNGEARALAVKAAYARTVQEAGDPLAPASPEVLAAARAAYIRAPLQPDLVAILASPMLARGDDAPAIRLLTSGHGFTRRSTLLNSQLMTAHSRNGQMEPAFALIDEILRRETAAQGPILNNLAQFAGNPAYASTILGILSAQVPWSAQFWRQVAQSAPGLQNAANLRIGYARQGGTPNPEIDRMIVIGLAGQTRYDDAARLAGVLFPEAMRQRLPARGNLLTNADFATSPDILPFDWDITNGGDHSAQIIHASSEMAISALPGANTRVARQLVSLPDGPLAISVDGTASSPEGRAGLTVRLTCADASRRVLLSAPAISLSRRVSPAGCRWAWFELHANIPAEGAGQDWTIRQVVLSPSA